IYVEERTPLPAPSCKLAIAAAKHGFPSEGQPVV
ncbi:hypothetical protein A2U01_0047827, partial [Trifolium medium]|nr:hypothetical protein [Trifolium medium]